LEEGRAGASGGFGIEAGAGVDILCGRVSSPADGRLTLTLLELVGTGCPPVD
jgi:hypothetical protein